MGRGQSTRTKSLSGWIAIVGATVAIAAAPTPGAAQELRGTVTDSASAQPIPGVVLTLLDANGAVLGRNITNERGDYRIAMSPGMQVAYNLHR